MLIYQPPGWQERKIIRHNQLNKLPAGVERPDSPWNQCLTQGINPFLIDRNITVLSFTKKKKNCIFAVMDEWFMNV